MKKTRSSDFPQASFNLTRFSLKGSSRPRLKPGLSALCLITAISLFFACQSGSGGTGGGGAGGGKLVPDPQQFRGLKADGYYYDTAEGSDLDDAKRTARRHMIEDGLGTYIRANSVAVDGQLKEQIIRAESSGFVYDFQVLRIIQRSPTVKIRARGKVSARALGKALKLRYAEIGKPRIMILFDETIGGKKSTLGRSIAESKLVAQFKDFEFIDKAQLQRIIAREGGKIAGAYGDSSAYSKALSAAVELEADILIVGEATVKQGPKIEGTRMHSIQAVMNLKVVGVSNARILAAQSRTAAGVHLNLRRGAVQALERAVELVHPEIIAQIGSKWEPGRVIRMVFEGIDYDNFVDLDLGKKLAKIKGVGRVTDRGKDANGNIVLEVEALMDGNRLYRSMRRERARLGLNFKSKEVKGGLIRLTVVK